MPSTRQRAHMASNLRCRLDLPGLEQAKEKELEAARRKRLKEKIAQYKLRVEQERATKAVKEVSLPVAALLQL